MEFVKLAGPAGMFFIMFSLALSLKTSAFKAIVSNPLSFYLGISFTINWYAINWFYYFFISPISS